MTRPWLLIPLLSFSCSTPGFRTSTALDPKPVGLPGVVLALSAVPEPRWAPRPLIRSRFEAALPEYERIAGLTAKAFVLGDSGEFGGIYVWQTAADADAWFNPRWFERTKKSYGGGAVKMFTDVTGLEGNTQLDATAVDAHSTRFPMAATVLVFAGGSAEAVVAAHRAPPGLVRAWAASSAAHEPVVIALWANRASAQAAYAAVELSQLVAAVGASTANVDWYEAPLWMDMGAGTPR